MYPPYPPGTPTNADDGVRVEAAVAAFLYDLVDGPNEPDSPSNTAGGEDLFDTLTVPGSWIADVMQLCVVNGTVFKLSGADQLIYCLEKSVGAYTEASQLSSSWRLPWAVGFQHPVATYDAAKIRTLWKFNLYGQ